MSPPKGECVENRSQFFQVPLSPIHESAFELPITNQGHIITNHQHPPLLASIGPQSRLLSKSIPTNCDNSQEAIEVQDIEVIVETYRNSYISMYFDVSLFLVHVLNHLGVIYLVKIAWHNMNNKKVLFWSLQKIL